MKRILGLFVVLWGLTIVPLGLIATWVDQINGRFLVAAGLVFAVLLGLGLALNVIAGRPPIPPR